MQGARHNNHETKSNGSIKHGLVSEWEHCVQNPVAFHTSSPTRVQSAAQGGSTGKRPVVESIGPFGGRVKAVRDIGRVLPSGA